MPLALNSGGGDFTPFIRFMASTSSWEMSQDGGTAPFTFTQAIVDLENIRTGWGLLGEGMAPQWVWDESIDNPDMKKPGEGEWKRGLSVDVFSPKMFGEESPVRELSSTGTGVKMGFEALYAEFEASAPANPGKVPVVKFEGAVRQKVGKGNTSLPTLKIIKWVDRPAELTPDDEAPAAAAPSEPAGAATPAAEPAASGDDEEF